MYREIALLRRLIKDTIQQQEAASDYYKSARDRFRTYQHSYCAERFKDFLTEFDDICGCYSYEEKELTDDGITG